MNKDHKSMRLLLLGFTISALLSCSSPESNPLPDRDQDRDTVYIDGVYTAKGEYGSLPSHITVTITLTNEIVSNTQVQAHATDPTSLDLQRRFAAAVPPIVNGKHISEVSVGRLAGSSGTPRGFNDAIRQIKVQAARVE